MESFDVDLVREYSERQRADAEKIVALCDALKKAVGELGAAREEIKALKAAPSHPGPSNPDNGK